MIVANGKTRVLNMDNDKNYNSKQMTIIEVKKLLILELFKVI